MQTHYKQLTDSQWQAMKTSLPIQRKRKKNTIYPTGILRRSPWNPRKNKLIQSKAETHIIESQNGRVRHYLARFKRKTLCYSKSVAMVHLTLLLFFVPLLYLSFKDNLIIFSRLDLVFSVSLHGKDCKYWHKKAIFRILKYKTKNFI